MCIANPVYLVRVYFCNRFRLSTHFVSFKASSVYKPGVLSGVMEGRGTSLHGLRVYVARRPQPRLRSSSSSSLLLLLLPKRIIALKTRNTRYRATRDEIKKEKAEVDKDKESLWDGNEAEVDDEQVLRCRMIAHH